MLGRAHNYEAAQNAGLIAARALDHRSLLGGALGGAGYLILGIACLAISRFDNILASVWLPDAFAVAFLLRVRLPNELPFYVLIWFGGVLANVQAGTPVPIAAVFASANLVNIMLVTWITRRACGAFPDMTQLADLARFVWAGALLGPIVSASLAAIAMGPDSAAIWEGAIAWFLTDSMGMILVVPAMLLLFDARREQVALTSSEMLERAIMLTAGLGCVFLVFKAAHYPLLFLIPPITLLHAFRLGSLGTALFVVGVAVIATGMSWSGLGPIAEATSSRTAQTHLIQGFVAANFLTGLPVAAILAGRARIVQELETGKRQLDILADNISDAVLHYDLDGICTYASPSVRDVLGEPPAHCIGARFSDNMHEDARERIMRAERQLLSGASQNERFTYRRFRDSEDGTPVFIEAECAIVTNGRNGERDGIVVAARDVTERVELELLLTRARRHAENAARAKSEFLANMSHEIRTPMNGVLGFAELMLQGELDPDQRRQTELIVESGRSMMMLLNDVLDLSRIEAGQIVIDNAPVDLEATLAECTALHRPSAEKKGVDLQFESAQSDIASASGKRAREGTQSKPWIMTDALRLRQIVLNLIGNAVKFTEHGRIKVTYRLVDSEFVVDVLDTGIGISPNRLETIFRPFTQGESDTARRFGGTGLGLSISRQLADLLGGKITVESEPGEGSRFTLTLPAIHARPEQRPLPPPEPISPEDLPHHARILLAEDHDVNRMLVREMLERCGQSVAIAHDGNEAISMVIDSIMRGSPYDLVLMDMQMPGCDGYAATRAIRAEGITPDILPIVALTANAFPEDIAAARDAGMQAHLAKPLVFADLARVLQRWLPTRIIEAEADQDTLDPSDADEQGPDQSEVVDLLHAAREHNGSPLRPKANPKAHSPALIRRWITRREEAIEAVRAALANGILNGDSDDADAREALAKLVHKLAGTAGMFGEPELGDQAAAFESAVRMELDGKVQEALAFELLSLADEPPGEIAKTGDGRS